MNTLETILNEKPSERILRALEALEDFENTPNCKVDMNYFHDISGSICFACLGGAYGLSLIEKEKWSEIYNQKSLSYILDEDYSIILSIEESLNDVRVGNIDNMFHKMGREYLEGMMFNREITPYGWSPENFKKDLTKLAEDLKQAGY